MSFSLPAPAKLNLFLHITGRRSDGYHTLQTVFALLDYGDTLHFASAEQLSLSAPVELGGDNNLILRAARALQKASNSQQGAAIHLDKRLPAGGGVGGGSSDAATALLGLNHLWQLNLSIDQLADIGLSDRKSTRLNSSHVRISYAVFCLKKKKKIITSYKIPQK